jgi:hypothetical protein
VRGTGQVVITVVLVVITVVLVVITVVLWSAWYSPRTLVSQRSAPHGA